MKKYVKTLKYMISQGYNVHKAVIALASAHALSPEDTVKLARIAEQYKVAA